MNPATLTSEESQALPRVIKAYLAGVADEARRKALHQTVWGRSAIIIGGLTYLHAVGWDEPVIRLAHAVFH